MHESLQEYLVQWSRDIGCCQPTEVAASPPKKANTINLHVFAPLSEILLVTVHLYNSNFPVFLKDNKKK